MSPTTPRTSATRAVISDMSSICHIVGDMVRTERRRRRWTLAELAHRCGLSISAVHSIEFGERGSLETFARVARALGLELQLELVDPRRRTTTRQDADLVHSAMGEIEVAHLHDLRYGVGVDEPYQHCQFAGRGDVVAWYLERCALLHIENRTRFPDIQAVAGTFNAKRAHLAASIAQRVGLRRFTSETHVVAALWSSEVLHTLRLRPATFRALCPDPLDSFEAWWRGEPPSSGMTSTFVLLDPAATGRQRRFISLDAALTSARPRSRGYAEVAERLRTSS